MKPKALRITTYSLKRPKYTDYDKTNKPKGEAMAEEFNTDFSKSVAGVVIKDGRVLLARHTYGGGKGKLIVPGGYVQFGERAEDAVCRELMEETGIKVKVNKLIAVRFNEKDWYAAFSAEYLSGEPVPDYDEISEVLWLDIDEALNRDDVPSLSKELILCALSDKGFTCTDYTGSSGLKATLYSCK